MAVATGLVALHVADDSFFQPASGTSAWTTWPAVSSRSSRSPLGAWAYPRVRSGAVLTIALPGLFGLIIGITEAGYYAPAKVGPSATTAACSPYRQAFLVGLGLWTVLGSRGSSTPGWRRYLRRALIAIVVVVAPSRSSSRSRSPTPANHPRRTCLRAAADLGTVDLTQR